MKTTRIEEAYSNVMYFLSTLRKEIAAYEETHDPHDLMRASKAAAHMDLLVTNLREELGKAQTAREA